MEREADILQITDYPDGYTEYFLNGKFLFGNGDLDLRRSMEIVALAANWFVQRVEGKD